jgi:PRTRC genetic system protein C
MALEITSLERVFNYKKDKKDIQLTDPNPSMSPEEVMKFYAGTHPELTNGIVEGPVVVKDKATYTMATKAGKLG